MSKFSNFFEIRDEWSKNHATVWVYGTTPEKLMEATAEYSDRDTCFFNGEYRNGVITFDLCVSNVRLACDELSAKIPEATFYSFESWDENDFYASKDGRHYIGYSIKSEGAPYIDNLAMLEDFVDTESFYELHFANVFSWEFTVLDESKQELFTLGAGNFSLEEVNAIWNKQ